MGESFLIKSGGANRLKKAISVIGVTYPQGSKCICVNSTETITLKAESTSGIWAFSVPETGTWTIACTADDGNIVKRNVEVVNENVSVIDIKYLTPIEYQAVEWLRKDSTTNDIVNTNYIPTSTSVEVELNFVHYDASRTNPFLFFGNYNTSTKTGIAGGYSGNANNFYLLGYGGADSIASTTPLLAYRRTIKWSFTENTRTIYLNGKEMGNSTKTSRLGTSGLVLFAGNSDGYYHPNILQIYNGCFYQDGEIVASFQPCYRKSDNKMGFWDDIRQMFLPVSDDSAFEKGQDTISYPDTSTSSDGGVTII